MKVVSSILLFDLCLSVPLSVRLSVRETVSLSIVPCF